MAIQFCNRSSKVIFHTELDAKIALADRIAKDKGEKRYYPCGKHFHLTSMPLNESEDVDASDSHLVGLPH